MSHAPAAPAPRASRTALRTGLALCILLTVLPTIPAVFDIGFDGSGWDIVVVVVAVLSPAIMIATLLLVPVAWKGRRRSRIAVAALQVVAMFPALPPFFHPFGVLSPAASVAALIGICLNALAASLVVVGLRDVR